VLLPDADAEKSADRERDVPELAERSIVQSARRVAAAELCRRDADRFAARSSAAPELTVSSELQGSRPAGPQQARTKPQCLESQAQLQPEAQPPQAELRMLDAKVV